MELHANCTKNELDKLRVHTKVITMTTRYTNPKLESSFDKF